MIVKNVEKKEHNTAVFQVEVEPEAFEKAVETAYHRAKNRIYVAGFRKGKAPRAVIEGMYGKDVFHDDAAQTIAPDAFEFGVGEAKLETVGAPSLMDYKVDDGTLTLTFSTGLYPEVTLGQYKGLEAVWAETPVEDARVDEALEDARKRAARYVDVDRPIQTGDTVVFDFEGFADGKAFEGGKAEDYTLEIGSGSFIPGFEDQMIGMTAGTDGEIHVTFPENYDPKLAGKDATFRLKIKTVREPQYPELDDEFAKDVSEFDTLEAYKADVRAKLEAEARERSERAFKSELLQKAADAMTCEVPEGMIEDKTDEFLRNYADSMGARGNLSRADLIKSLGMTEESFAQIVRPNAEKQARSEILLDEVAKAENIEISQEDKDDFYKKLADDYGSDAEKVKAMISEELMVRDLARQKAAAVIYDSGVRTAPAPEEPKAEDAPAAEAPAEEKKED